MRPARLVLVAPVEARAEGPVGVVEGIAVAPVAAAVVAAVVAAVAAVPAVEAVTVKVELPVAAEAFFEVATKKAPRRKPKKAEEIIPPSAPEPVAVVDVVLAPEPAAEEPAPSGRRRAPALDDAPPRPAPPLDDGARLRPRVRRASTAMVEVVRVPKKP